jgi:DNA-directed RNA polymerase specialized sigma24 family protein
LPDDLAGGADPAAASAARDQTATVWREVERLVPRAQFEALWLFYAEDLSVSAIARVLARSEALVKVQLFRARRRLATELAPELRPAGVTGRAVAENSEAGPAGFGASPEGEST